MLALELLVKGTVLIAVVVGIANLLRGASAATRHLVWSCGLLGMLLLPLLTAMPWRVAVIPALGEATVAERSATPATETEAPVWEAREAGAETATPAANPNASAGSVDAVTSDGDAVPAETGALAGPADGAASTAGNASAASPAGNATAVEASWTDRLPLGSPIPLLLAVWALGALAVGGRYLAGLVSVRRIVARARVVEDPQWNAALDWAADRLLLDSDVRLLASDDVPMPLTAGVLRPVVVLPTSALDWSMDRRRAVLVHELAHVRRKDALAHALTWAAMALWWFHPLVRMTARQSRAESERACDDLVLRAGTRASSYADHLLEIVCASDGRAPAAAMPLAQRSEFEGRMIRILAPDVRRHGLSALRTAAMLAAVLALAVPLAAAGMAEPRPADPIAAEPGTEIVDEAAPPVEEWNEPAETDAPADSDREVDADLEVAGELDGESLEDAGTATPADADGAVAEVGFDLSLLQSIDEKTTREWVRDGTRAAGSLLRAIPPTVIQDGKIDADELRDTVLPAMVEALLDDDSEVRAMVARALGAIDDPRAIDALMRALREDADADVRKMAAWALGEIESPRAIPGLARAIREDAVWEVRKMAVWALGEIESPDGVEALRVALGDAHAEVREYAVWALGEIEDEAAVPALVEALRDGSVEIRRKAAWALGEIESPDAVGPLGTALGDADAEVRQQAAWALGEIESPAAVPALGRAVTDADPDVRAKAAWALGEIEDPRAVPALRGLLDDSSAEVRKYAVWALTEIEAPAAYDVLVQLLKDDDPEVRKAAARALGNADADWDTDTDTDVNVDR